MGRTVNITTYWQGNGKEMSGSSHTLPCCLGMPGSRVEAGKKQAKRSLEYGYSMESVLLYPSFVASSVFLLPPLMARRWFEDGSKMHTPIESS